MRLEIHSSIFKWFESSKSSSLTHSGEYATLDTGMDGLDLRPGYLNTRGNRYLLVEFGSRHKRSMRIKHEFIKETTIQELARKGSKENLPLWVCPPSCSKKYNQGSRDILGACNHLTWRASTINRPQAQVIRFIGIPFHNNSKLKLLFHPSTHYTAFNLNGLVDNM